MQSGIAPGRRICVVGTSGSGKTYVAQALAKRLSITYISNDAIIWRPNWVPTPDDARLAASDAATRQSAWIFDGNLSLWRAEDRLVLDRCDTVVWLDLPRWQVWSQVIWRTLRRYVTREELWHGNRESLRITFSRNSTAWWGRRSARDGVSTPNSSPTRPRPPRCVFVCLAAGRRTGGCKALAAVSALEPNVRP